MLYKNKKSEDKHLAERALRITLNGPHFCILLNTTSFFPMVTPTFAVSVTEKTILALKHLIQLRSIKVKLFLQNQ